MKDISHSVFFDLTNYVHKELFERLQRPWEALSKIKPYLASQVLGKIDVAVPKEVYLIHPELISIGEGTILEPGAYIKGPCIIGKNCTVRHGAYIRGDFICGDNCVIGHDTEIKSVIFLNDVKAGHFAYVGDSILGNNVNLGAGTKCANLKLDSGRVFVRLDRESIDTGLKKFGAVIGDNVQTGCNSVLNPGTLMGKESLCYPCTNFGGYIEARHVVRPAQPIEIVKRLER